MKFLILNRAGTLKQSVLEEICFLPHYYSVVQQPELGNSQVVPYLIVQRCAFHCKTYNKFLSFPLSRYARVVHRRGCALENQVFLYCLYFRMQSLLVGSDTDPYSVQARSLVDVGMTLRMLIRAEWSVRIL